MSTAGNDVKGTSSTTTPADRWIEVEGVAEDAAALGGPDQAVCSQPGRAGVLRQVQELVRTIRDGDDTMVQTIVVQLSHRRRILAPLALAVGALAMLFHGLRLLLFNWRLTLVQVLPAMWIWAAMLDLKLHVLHGASFHVLRGPVLIPIMLGVVAITAATFFLNAVFAFAIVNPGPPKIRPAFTKARSHLWVVLGWGTSVGLLLGFSTVVAVRWGPWWFAVSLSIVLGIMMVSYVAVPSRLIGIRTTRSRRDKLTAAAVGGALGAVVTSPPYLLGRVGILMLGSRTFFILGIILLCVGGTLEAGAEGAVKAVKVSAKLVVEGHSDDGEAPDQGRRTR
ncbi:MAG TPA: hypothetical protein VMU14_08200 [Acidimicrobiales bacterium]|nr:hypothetical protein [Acidimicrobiales bacterium]